MPKGTRRSGPRQDDRWDPHWQALGRAIKTLRTERGMERAELAEASRLSYPYLAEIENGKKRPSSSALMAIADALEMKPHELMASTEWRMGPATESLSSMRLEVPVERGSWFSADEDAAPMMAVASDRAGPDDARAKLDALIDRMVGDDVGLLLDIARRLVSQR